MSQQAKALYANSADTEEELNFAVGDVLTVHERDVAGLAGWWLCSHAGRLGIAPGNRLRLLTPTGDSIVAGSSNRQTATADDSGKRDSSSSSSSSSTMVRPRPSTAPHGGHAAQNINVNSANKVSRCYLVQRRRRLDVIGS